MPGDIAPVDGRSCEQRLLEWLSDVQARGLRVLRLKITMRQWRAMSGVEDVPALPPAGILTFCGIPVDVAPLCRCPKGVCYLHPSLTTCGLRSPRGE